MNKQYEFFFTMEGHIIKCSKDWALYRLLFGKSGSHSQLVSQKLTFQKVSLFRAIVPPKSHTFIEFTVTI